MISIVIPTFNEVKNIIPLLTKLTAIVKDCEYEIIIVDEISNNLSLASRNLPNVNVTNLNTLNPINLLKFNSVVIAENCLNLIEEKLS